MSTKKILFRILEDQETLLKRLKIRDEVDWHQLKHTLYIRGFLRNSLYESHFGFSKRFFWIWLFKIFLMATKVFLDIKSVFLKDSPRRIFGFLSFVNCWERQKKHLVTLASCTSSNVYIQHDFFPHYSFLHLFVSLQWMNLLLKCFFVELCATCFLRISSMVVLQHSRLMEQSSWWTIL